MKRSFFNFNDDEDDGKRAESSTAAIATFCDKYELATKETLTALFSTKEIQKLVEDHIGYALSLPEINELLKNMGYTYQLENNEFMWMVKTA